MSDPQSELDAAIAQALAAAIELHQAGQLAEAEALYRQILAANPDHVEALHLLGVIAHQAGANDAAAELIGRAIQLSGTEVRHHNNFGLVCRALGRLDAAEASFRRALALAPGFAEAWGNLGLTLHDAGRLAEAAAALEQALALAPGFVEAQYNLGNTKQALGDASGAIACYRQALALKPDFADAYANLGAVLLERGALAEARACFERALAAKPEDWTLHNNLGNVLAAEGDLEAAGRCYALVVSLAPDYAAAYVNIGNIRREAGDLAGAAASLTRAAALAPENAEAQWNLGLLRLLEGDFARGWPLHEWRFKVRQLAAPQRFSQPRWRGERLGGATILLHSEQGLGDTLQFVRYVPLVAAAGGRVILEVPPELHRLLSATPGAAAVVPLGDPLPDFAWQSPLMSLPLAFGTELRSIPAEVPYLAADPALVATWRARLPAEGFNVGLVWAGRPQHKRDRWRSLALERLAPLAEIPGVNLFSLQKGDAARQATNPPSGMNLTDLAPSLDDFADTAAGVATLDLVVTVDTSVAHLAGALGRPVWILLPYAPDWRWLCDRTDSPWYPTARLFRQPAPGAWDPAIAAVTAALHEARQGSDRESTEPTETTE